MIINENTKYIARLHRKPSPRGLNIYNPYFEKTGTNCVYELFYNEDPRPLLLGIKNLLFVGGITVGFETDPLLLECEIDVDILRKCVIKGLSSEVK